MTVGRGRGRPMQCRPDVLLYIVQRRFAGTKLREICAELNAAGVPTPAGGTLWNTGHVSRLYYTRAAVQIRAGLDLN